MSATLCLRNRQRACPVNLPLLRRVTRHLLAGALAEPCYELGIHLVGAGEMALVNETFLNHTGSTDVITFDHAVNGSPGSRLHGELFICLDDAVAQARRFRTTWQLELTRYVVHGILHLRGHDDLAPGPRKAMKREEGRLVRQLAAHFSLTQLARRKTSAAALSRRAARPRVRP